jgi:hypothetical protein
MINPGRCADATNVAACRIHLRLSIYKGEAPMKTLTSPRLYLADLAEKFGDPRRSS